MPLVYRALSQHGAALVPPDVLAELQAQYQANVRRNVVLTRELLRLLALLEQRGIAALPFKGPALTVAAYGDLALRQFGDLDILVGKQDVLHAKDLLMAEGYQPQARLNRAQEQVLLRTKNVYDFRHPDGKVLLELHWKLTPRYFPFQFDLDQAWQQAEPITLAGAEVPHFSPEDLLLMQCVLGGKHCWTQLKWLCDVAELIRTSPTMHWSKVIALAKRSGHKRNLLLGLTLAADLLEAAVPETIIIQARSDPGLTALARQATAWLSCAVGREVGIFQIARFRVNALDRVTDKLWYGLDLIANPNQRDWDSTALPPAISFLYRPIRWIRLLGKYGLARAR
jgi:hypothetical protein